MINILVCTKTGSNFSISCDNFHVSDDFIHFSLNDYTICSIYAPDVKYFYSFHYEYVNDDYVKFKDMLFDNGIVLKTI